MGLIAALGALARFGRWVLPVGLAAGVLLPDLAALLRPWLPHMAALLLTLSAFRTGLRRGVGSGGEILQALGLLALLQLALPFGVALALGALSVPPLPAVAAALLVLAGSPISGAPNIAVLLGRAPDLPLRLLLIGTAVLPLTSLAVFAAWPALTGGQSLTGPVLRLMAVVLGGGALGFALRAGVSRHLNAQRTAAVDGLSTLVLAVMVIGLMSAVGPALRQAPADLAFWLIYASALNFGLQLATRALLRRSPLRDVAEGIAIVAGNRNIALFLVALPAEVIAPLLLFIGCYQVPMFLTPLVMARIWR